MQTPHEARMCPIDFEVQRSRSQCINYWKWFPAHNCFPFTPIIMKLHMQTPHEARMCPIDFEVKRSKVKVTMHKLLKMVSFLEKLFPRGVFVPLGQPRSSLHWITRRLCSVRHPSGAGCSKCLTFCTFEIWDIWHFCVKVSNTTTDFVVKRCKYKYWIAIFRCSSAIWIASERSIKFAFLSDAIHMAREHRQNAIQCLNKPSDGSMRGVSFLSCCQRSFE